MEIYKTGGGMPPKKLEETKVRLLSFLKPQMEPLQNKFDSSAAYFGGKCIIYYYLLHIYYNL